MRSSNSFPVCSSVICGIPRLASGCVFFLVEGFSFPFQPLQPVPHHSFVRWPRTPYRGRPSSVPSIAWVRSVLFPAVFLQSGPESESVLVRWKVPVCSVRISRCIVGCIHAQSPVTNGAAQSGFVERLELSLVFQVGKSVAYSFFRQ